MDVTGSGIRQRPSSPREAIPVVVRPLSNTIRSRMERPDGFRRSPASGPMRRFISHPPVAGGMLDVVARSQRGRVCEYSRSKDGPRLSMPAVLSEQGDGPDGITVTGSGRVLRLLGTEVPLEHGLLTTASSGMRSETVVKDGIEIVRLPVADDLVIDPSAEVVVVPNAFELRHDARRIVDSVIRLREKCGFGRVLCMLGIAEPSSVALLAYMGVDLFDDSLPRAAGSMGVRLVPEAEMDVGGDQSEENAGALLREVSLVRDFIMADRLRELADQRSFSTPSGVALLRLYDDIGYAYAEEACPTVGGRFCSNTVQSLRRPDVLRYRRDVSGYRKPACKRILVLLPCSAKKPYHISKSHRAFASAIHTAPHDTLVHEVIVTSPLGVVPRDLDMFYPACAYDIPVTGEWTCQEKAFIRSMVADVIAQGYDKVICHLGEDCELVEGLADMECTVVGDPTSPKSLENLDSALREAAKGMELPGYMVERNDRVRSVLGFQFGGELADAIMDADTYAIGKFPYWKIVREKDGRKVQLGMMTPERGMVSLTLEGAEIAASLGWHTVEIQDFDLKGNLFAVGVISADPRIRIGDEAVFVCNGEVRGVGVAAMCGREMTELTRGIAVKVRHKVKRRARRVFHPFSIPLRA